MTFGISSLYHMYFMIRSKFKPPSIIATATIIHYIFQMCPLAICFLTPIEIFNATNGSSFFHYYESMMLFLPWLFGTESMLFDTLFYFVINIAAFIILICCLHYVDKYKHLNFWACAFISVFQSCYTQLISFPLYFRFSYMMELIINQPYNPEFIISLTLTSINTILNGIHIYMASIFLIPADFVIHTKFDLYDGKSVFYLYWVRFLLSTACFFFKISMDNQILVISIIVACFIITLNTIYNRINSYSYVSRTGLATESFPLFCVPFMMLMFYLFENWVYSILSLVLVFALFLFMQFIHYSFLIKQATKTFSPFIIDNKDEKNNNHNIESEESLPSIGFGSRTTMIRIMASHHCDPNCIDRYLKLHKKLSSKASTTLEVIRFLALFPTRRNECLKELALLTSKSHHNRFAIYRFTKILKGLTEQTSEKHRLMLNRMNRSFLVHHHLYWMARKEKKQFTAFREAFSTAFYYIETDFEFKMLIDKYPLDSVLHYMYSDFLLSACGDFEGHKKEQSLALNIERGKHNIIDPLLHPMSLYNPKILQYCTVEEAGDSPNSYAGSSMIGTTTNNNMSFFGSEISSAFNNQKLNKSNPIITFLGKSKRYVPALAPIHTILPMILILVIIFSMLSQAHHIESSTNILFEESSLLMDAYYLASSGVFIPYFLSIRTPMEDCQQDFISMPFVIAQNYDEIQVIRNLTSGMLSIINEFVSETMLNQFYYELYDVCDMMEALTTSLNWSILLYIDLVSNIIDIINEEVELLEGFLNSQYSIVPLVIISISCAAAFVLLSFIITFIQVNTIMNDPKVIEFLSKEEWLSLCLLQDSKKAWELYRNFVDPHEISTSNSAGTLELHKTPKILSNSSLNMNESQQFKNSAFNVLSLDDSHKRRSVNPISPLILEIPHQQFQSNNNISNIINTSNTNSNNGEKKENEEENCNKNENGLESDENSDFNSDKNRNTIFEGSEMEEFTTNGTNNDIIEQEIQATLVDDLQSRSYCLIFTLLMAPSFLLVLIVSLYFLPIKFRAHTQIMKIGVISECVTRINASFVLVNYTYSIIENRPPSILELELIHSILDKPGTLIGELYMKEQCYQLDSVICISVKTILHNMITQNITSNVLATKYMPIIHLFAWNSIFSYYFPRILDFYQTGYSNGTSFIIAVLLFMINFLSVTGAYSKLLFAAFNSLYHFPNDFLKLPDEGNDKKKNNVLETFPENVLVITTVTETDEIYSITENTKSLLNRSLNDMISLIFSKTFPIVHGAENLREFVMPDKKKKIFRYSSEIIGMMTKTVMVEEVTPVQDPREKTYSKRLIEYVPPYFAKQFGDNDVCFFEYKNCFIVSVRIKPNLQFLITDKFFNASNHVTQNFSSMNILHIDGEMVIFSSFTDVSPFLILLFIRDLINEAKVNSKNVESNFALCSIVIDYFDEISCIIRNSGIEPFLEFNPKPSFFMNRLFRVNENLIAFSQSSKDLLPIVNEKAQKYDVPVNFKGETESFWGIQVNQFLSDVILPSM
ncbi:hypothetical protein TRFO_40943 [Tritrichomonas foetus]|uniref:Transmembrane protein n=1 Tax=Tritrichomonas foetus TaxID=1144522 RepID=A0A1J4J5J3_9EUKA|nr:hypothetical protein TRFO_40943 [Tritrichomonas foetus]|eukprot:OHS92725.1 hypothetical protein TRFO_40943 [Tritrichomonas foetus]